MSGMVNNNKTTHKGLDIRNRGRKKLKGFQFYLCQQLPSNINKIQTNTFITLAVLYL